MVAAAQNEPWITETLSWSEICRRYPDEWVWLVERAYVSPDTTEVVAARVVSHGTTLTESSEQASCWLDTYDRVAYYPTSESARRNRGPGWTFRRVIVDDEI